MAPAFLSSARAVSTSARVDIPELIIIGSFLLPMILKYGILVISPEPIFIKGIPSEIKKSRLASSSAVEANCIPILSQYSFIFLKSS